MNNNRINNIERKKAVFMDRDGTINKYVDYLNDIDAFELIDGVGEAIRKINRSDYLAIVITNQPMIAMGLMGIADLEKMHDKMKRLLAERGAYLDGIYYCPHKPGDFEGGNPEYMIDCDCRKPKPGMFFKAAQDFNIDLSKSYMLGDKPKDMEAAVSAGCIPVFLGQDILENVLRYDSVPAFVEDNIELFERKNY